MHGSVGRLIVGWTHLDQRPSALCTHQVCSQNQVNLEEIGKGGLANLVCPALASAAEERVGQGRCESLAALLRRCSARARSAEPHVSFDE